MDLMDLFKIIWYTGFMYVVYKSAKSIVMIFVKSPFEKGQNALLDGSEKSDNPYNSDTESDKFKRWENGYDCDWLLTKD